MPHLGIFFGKKIPKNPKKPNRIRYRLSSIDSEQGCRRQPCFYVRRTRCGTATAPPHLPAIPPTFAAPALLRAHRPSCQPLACRAHIAHALATLPASLTRSESVCLLRRRLFAAPHTRLPLIPQYSRAVVTVPYRRARLPDAALKLQPLSFFTKHFKLCRQLVELK